MTQRARITVSTDCIGVLYRELHAVDVTRGVTELGQIGKQGSDAIVWDGQTLRLLDQRRLPEHVEYLALTDAPAVVDAIANMVVRGAPAIGIAAAYAVAMSVREHTGLAELTPKGALGGSSVSASASMGRLSWRAAIEPDLQALGCARPTAVNLAWAIARMRAFLAYEHVDPVAAAMQEAARIHAEDIAANRRMGEIGARLIARPCGVLTHCNAGALATGGYGTALGVVRSAYAAGKIERVFADETRPWLQGARLTAWELQRDGIPVHVISDSAAGYAMRQGKVEWVIVGADRVARNGDVANKIGTYSLAVNARHHGVKFMVVAPTSTIDLNIPHGDAVPIEMRGEEEILWVAGKRVAAPGVGAWNPVFDVTPAGLVDVLVTENGAIEAPDEAALLAHMHAN